MCDSKTHQDDSSATRDIRLVLWHALPIKYQRLIDGVPHVMILRTNGYACVPMSELTPKEVRRLGRACGLFKDNACMPADL